MCRTHTLRAFVRDFPTPAAPGVKVVVDTIGYTPSDVLGSDDSESGGVSFSGAADLARPGTNTGATPAIVTVQVPDSPFATGHQLELSCLDINGTEVGDPTIKQLQDEHRQ